MKGFSVQKGIELRVEIEGEKWAQGDSVRARLSSKAAAPLYLALASGNEKKVKAKSEGAFQILGEKTENSNEISHEFMLPLDAPITDKSSSPYLLYGIGNPSESSASLRLQVVPHVHLMDFSEVLTHHFRFGQRSIVNGKKNRVDFKFEPSGGKEWASLEELIVSFKLGDAVLGVQWVFHRKEINALKSALTAQSTQRTLERSLELKTLVHDFNQRLDKERVIEELESVFTEYRSQNGLF